MLSIGVPEKVTGHGAPAVLGVSYSCACCQVLPLLGAFPLPHPTEQPVFHRADCLPWVPLTVPEATGLPEVRKGQYNSQGSFSTLNFEADTLQDTKIVPQAGGHSTYVYKLSPLPGTLEDILYTAERKSLLAWPQD